MIYLAQTDTTAGFLSKDLTKINQIKRRRVDTPCLITLAKFSNLKILRAFHLNLKTASDVPKKLLSSTQIYAHFAW